MTLGHPRQQSPELSSKETAIDFNKKEIISISNASWWLAGEDLVVKNTLKKLLPTADAEDLLPIINHHGDRVLNAVP